MSPSRHAAIEDALNRYGKPKFIVLVKEKITGKRSKIGFTDTEMAIQEVMGNSGFEFIDPSMTQALVKRNKKLMNQAANGQINKTVADFLLNESGAEVVIVGSTITKDQSAAIKQYGSNFHSRQAIVKLKAIDINTGRVIASASKNAPGIHIEPRTASKKAVEACLKKILGKINRDSGKFKPGPFMNRIVKAFVKAATNRQINITIKGLGFSDASKFRAQISHRIRGVKQVIPKKQTGKLTKLELYFAGKTNDFADELVNKAAKLGFKIQILEIAPNRIAIKAKRIK